MEQHIPDLSTARFFEDLYERWKSRPDDVSVEWQRYFQSLDSGRSGTIGVANGQPSTSAQPLPGVAGPAGAAVGAADELNAARAAYKQSRVNALIWAYRDVGYIYADLNPLKNYSTPELRYLYYTMQANYEKLSLSAFGLTDEDLDQQFSTGGYFQPERMKLRDLVGALQQTYCASIGAEILHIQNKPMRRWLIDKIESPASQASWTPRQKIRFQKDLIKAEEFEQFVQSNFIGQKRFSLEGGEVLIPALRFLIDSAADRGLKEIVLGMAHRGRLNVFTNALRKPGAETFSRFFDNYMPYTYGGSGDVKYHLGHSFSYTTAEGAEIHISLVANPSHLEAVDPVVEGKCRAIQRRRKDWNRKKVVPVLIHGDAAFSGQGVVAETFNLMQLKGYRTGGTVHIVLNNQIGFTTASRDARSSFFPTDIAKAMPVPIFHANGDDPEAVSRAINLAIRFRQKFGYDAVVDIICYRRLGHNEADEPSFTHPIMYELIRNHESVAAIYGRRLADEGVYSAEDQQRFRQKYRAVLKEELQKARSGYQPGLDDAFQGGDWSGFQRTYTFELLETGVQETTLRKIASALTTPPEGFALHSKLRRFLKDREQAIKSGEGIDWSFAESLSFGSLLIEGYPIRLSGEDSARATFSQRHAVWWDVETSSPKTYTPLQHVDQDQAWFSVYDSPLSEFAVLGFDYGYSLAQPQILVLWEAQFGDFANGAQVIIDQFISSAESKWFRASGLVMLLPHGYEGQGPEHSSAHLERYLQLCADNNIQVVNPTTPAQYFHALRRQMKQPFRKPLIIMTPKSLLRHKECVSQLGDLTSGSFLHLIDDTVDGDSVTRLILCSGKIYYDLLQRRQNLGRSDIALVRLEQIYPFDFGQATSIIGRYNSDADVIWCQEETRNRGAYSFVLERINEILAPGGRSLTYIGRAASPSPATGSYKQHIEELEVILAEAVGSLPQKQPSDEQPQAKRERT
ncbi:MAG: 2-oxoglutarate dehydrogenase E1 component [Spirochaetaceae bacterium]|nr:MAG: 2-oxoglutarate dehydrogenase E1 component [Spirochaetaceae bacterium]